ncbi:hypothetical protein SODALDRAFT_379694 [Sodiomyces alkalinus F11]|uniref:Uncharacterized protein n=1 Tax=Sodiomyces alkalinus (strain CBS 110278 / VKM F-3762 / F11) TaxID=1314773 RepID=A0A3N2PRU2_SODAK|nr:hypothetical protein SODALDRAFT_379694 [Sodiomyces alkalinus F11]ROT37217.1 hypothetical protein SODALDRAFT_379694 [Sodiomyces alkalinus F11]
MAAKRPSLLGIEATAMRYDVGAPDIRVYEWAPSRGPGSTSVSAVWVYDYPGSQRGYLFIRGLPTVRHLRATYLSPPINNGSDLYSKATYERQARCTCPLCKMDCEGLRGILISKTFSDNSIHSRFWVSLPSGLGTQYEANQTAYDDAALVFLWNSAVDSCTKDERLGQGPKPLNTSPPLLLIVLVALLLHLDKSPPPNRPDVNLVFVPCLPEAAKCPDDNWTVVTEKAGNPDLEHGIIVWTDPWDPIGWEVTEGCWRNFSFLFDGCYDMLHSTNRWRALRGEDSLAWEWEVK